MAIVTTQPLVSGNTPKYVNEKSMLGKEDFLKLLVAQLQHQDPLNPMDSAEFTAQLAQFSSLEQQRNINENLASLISIQKEGKLLEVAGLVGKNVLASTNEIVWEGSDKVNLGFELPQDVASGTITITDSMGNLIRTIQKGGLNKGYNSISWDGRNNSGVLVPPGRYYYAVSGITKDKSSVSGEPILEGKIDAVKYQDGSAYLVVDGREIATSKIIKITQPEGNGGTK